VLPEPTGSGTSTNADVHQVIQLPKARPAFRRTGLFRARVQRQPCPRQFPRTSTQAGDMKKTFALTSPKHQPARVVEQIKADVRKYVKRERKKTLPEGVDFWDFNCKVGHGEAEPQAKHVEEVIPSIDQAAAAGCEAVYIEILAIPGHRKSREAE
jgi:hypothetical protein